MRGFAWRFWSCEAFDCCRGPANTTIVHSTVIAPHHGCQRFHAAFSSPAVTGRDRQRVIRPRRERMAGGGRDGENVGSRMASGGAAWQLFAARRMGIKPPSRAEAIARKRAARIEQPSCRRPTVRAATSGSGEDRLASGHIAAAERAPMRQLPAHLVNHPPRCLKRLPTSLEAIGWHDRHAESRGGRRQPRASTTRTFRGRAFCRGRARRSWLHVNPRERALPFVGVA